MRILPRQRLISVAVMCLALGWVVSGCSDSGEEGSAVVGTWNATSFNALGQDLVAQGMGISFTFSDQASYSFSVTNDQNDVFCNPGPDCTDGGSYVATATQITLDPGTTDAAVLNYAINGTTMTVNAVIEGAPITATFAKQ